MQLLFFVEECQALLFSFAWFEKPDKAECGESRMPRKLGRRRAFILKEFDEASLWLSNQGVRQHIFTNAIRYSASISHILKSGSGTICVSLDSASSAMYKAVKQVDKFSQVLANIKRYISESNNAFGVYLKYIVFEKNNHVHEIESFLKLCLSLGVSNIELSFNFREVNAQKLSQKTMLAAAFFEKRAASLGLTCEKFFISPKNRENIVHMKEILFQSKTEA